MDEVSMCDLRNAGGEVLARVAVGEFRLVTRDALLTRWRSVPVIDAAAFREDVDAALDPAL